MERIEAQLDLALPSALVIEAFLAGCEDRTSASGGLYQVW